MSRKRNKLSQVLSVCVLITFLLLCSFNVVYAYFTSSSSISGSSNFGTLEIRVSKKYKVPATEKYTQCANSTWVGSEVHCSLNVVVLSSEPENWDVEYDEYYTRSGLAGSYVYTQNSSSIWVASTFYSVTPKVEYSQPADYSTNYSDYYKATIDTYIQNSSSTWSDTTIYCTLASSLLESQPGSWNSTYQNYYVRSGTSPNYSYVQNTSSDWVASTYYSLTPTLVEDKPTDFSTGTNYQNYFVLSTNKTIMIQSSDVSAVSTDNFNTQTQVIPVAISGNLKRNQTYRFTVDGCEVDELELSSLTGSCDSYIRFTIEARKVIDDPDNVGKYILDTSDTTDYGSYFELVHGNSIVYNSDNNFYYIKDAVSANDNVQLTTSVYVSNTLPVVALDCKMAFKITYQAVQVAHDGYLAVFADDLEFIEDELNWG